MDYEEKITYHFIDQSFDDWADGWIFMENEQYIEKDVEKPAGTVGAGEGLAVLR